MYSLHKSIDFNPRSREGSDAKEMLSMDEYQDFNPRSREGSDQTGCTLAQTPWIFQSTLPRGERLITG